MARGVGPDASANTSTTASVNTTYGIFVGTGASTVAQTTAPAAISSISTHCDLHRGYGQ